MTNKYAIYCDSLEDEQLLKNWIKKEFKSDFYNSDKFQKKKLFFGFPNYHNYQGFLEGQHTSSFISDQLKDYIEINIKDFLKEYYMKELTELPKSWAVKCDGSQLFKDTVIKYLDNNSGGHFKGQKDAYYGITFQDKVDWYFHGIDQYFDTILTLDQFIKLTTKNMKTELLGLPVIRGEKHHLEAFLKDCEKFGHNSYITKEEENLTLIYNNYDEQTILKNDEAFKTLFVGRIERNPIYNSGTKAKIFQYNLPQDWSKALDFMKENMDRWLKIQEENKEPEFKIGDIVTIKLKPKNWDSGAGGQYPLDYKKPVTFPFTGKIENIVTDWKTSYNISGYGFSSDAKIEPATPQEIEEYNNKPKIFKMTSTSGDFELEVSKKGIYYRPEDKWLEPYHIKSIIEPCEQNYISISGDDCYSFQFETVKVGCKAGIPISCWKQVYDYYKSISQ